MSVHKLSARQLVPIPLEEAWAFFSDPGNLSVMTPSSLAMKVTSSPPAEMYAGLIVTYTMSPLPIGFLRAEWVTEITQVQPPMFFVDEQRSGPYRLWHHEHHFQEVEGGAEIRDLIHYQLPFGPLGGRDQQGIGSDPAPLNLSVPTRGLRREVRNTRRTL